MRQGAISALYSENTLRSVELPRFPLQSITSVTVAASESSSAAMQVLASASELSKNAERLRHELATFLGSIRAA